MNSVKASLKNVVGLNPSKSISDATFARFFSALLSLCILVMLFLELDLKRLIFGSETEEKKSGENIIRALLENTQVEKNKKKETVKFLSDKDSEARGDLTKQKGFEAISMDDVLSMGQPQRIQAKIVSAKRLATLLTSKEGRTRIHIATAKEQPTTAAEQLRIPGYHRFRNELALSWDYRGNPIIPTVRYPHFKYFRDMINKIRSVWAPPGGDPSAFYDRSGHMTYATFPTQDIYVMFMIDANGIVHDVKLVSSLGFKSLDQSIIEAIYVAKDFGPPPPELLERGTLILPFIFHIVVW